MKHAKLADMRQGWFAGDFTPAALQTSLCEVAVKHYSAGDTEPVHFHRQATEVTVVISGCIEMAGGRWDAGDIVVLDPLEATGFLAVTDAVNLVLKIPSAPGDKFLGYPAG